MRRSAAHKALFNVYLLDEPLSGPRDSFDLTGYEPGSEQTASSGHYNGKFYLRPHYQLEEMDKVTDVVLKRGVTEAPNGDTSHSPISITSSWTDHNEHDPGISPSASEDDWYL